MNYYEMRVSYDSAWGALGHLGTISSVELEDLNQNIAVMMRPFVNYVKRCLSLTDRISFMRELMAKKDITVPIFDDYGIFMSNLKDGQEKSGDIYLEKLEADVNSKYSTLKRNTETLDQLNTRHLDLVEKKTVITLTKPILPQGFRNYISAGSSVAALASGIRFNYICGVLKNEDLIKFQKLLFRMSRGNSYLKVLNIPIEKDKDGNVINCRKEDNGTPIQMSLIFLAYSTSAAANTDVISNKYLKLADTFGVRRYTLPVDQQASEDEIAELNTEILNIIEVKKTTQTEIEELLKELSSKRGESPCVLIDELRLKVLREKCIYENFDRMRLKDRIFYARMWIPEEDEVKIRRMIAEFAKAFGFNPPELEIKDWAKLKKTPPTHYRTNEFTKPYLNIVETYGIPRYQEMNPAPFSIATFPYQFGVMFGDVGHGGLLFAGTSILVYLADELKRKKLVPKALLEIRYLFWFMGFMAFYCGFTYNEFFAIPLKLFTSCYNMNSPEIERHHSEEGCVYPIGMDPAWYMAKNEVSYFNSFKMKLSIVIGVAHMLMGIFIRGANNIYFKQPIDFIFEFIPQVVFMSSTFGYMCVCIFIKWSTDFTGRTPPSILNIFTGMGIAVRSALT